MGYEGGRVSIDKGTNVVCLRVEVRQKEGIKSYPRRERVESRHDCVVVTPEGTEGSTLSLGVRGG